LRVLDVPESTEPRDSGVQQRPAEVFGGHADRWLTPQQRAAESFQRGMELVRDKRYEDALREWERAAALDPDTRIYQVNLRRLRERPHGRGGT
jgi:hypothetical protein